MIMPTTLPKQAPTNMDGMKRPAGSCKEEKYPDPDFIISQYHNDQLQDAQLITATSID